MSQVGTGPEDWAEFDFDSVELDRRRRDRAAIAAAVADRARREPDRCWEVSGNDPVVLRCDGRPRYQLTVMADGRVVFTSLLGDPPLL